MKSFIAFLSTFLVMPYLASAGDLSYFWSRFECDDPQDYADTYGVNITCAENSMPPWPICLFHNITYFIEASVSSASRCCNATDLEECRCPVKDHPLFAIHMAPWCDAIATCPVDTALKPELMSDAWGGIFQRAEDLEWEKEDWGEWKNGKWSEWEKYQHAAAPVTSGNSDAP
mmetsp:Transcript_9457/g.13893  ORF Transcript_9457/g.13893 Transcript_9457/m.13893 type:complete len:173 (+) Transcript_9457:76-594(+)|eukprot:CAMPEP_0197238270 /NCGR_PEP_ID=MMETSP1429-20130617/4797_1 /TAXON_ID=49237 /ORGANISM="Chaetoceros  sp., Strain UNC1202" /LENGTH=172 /DNA_ID=CAMNT_0042697387 /DNA_START=76 /DNA_END=594 /DNA_ORIENTATION=+